MTKVAATWAVRANSGTAISGCPLNATPSPSLVGANGGGADATLFAYFFKGAVCELSFYGLHTLALTSLLLTYVEIRGTLSRVTSKKPRILLASLQP